MRALSFIAMLLVITTAVYSGELKKEINAKPGGLLDVEINMGGTISIRGWDKDLVQVTTSFRGRELDEDVWVEIKDKGDGVYVHAGSDRNRSEDLEFEIYVPSKYNLELNTLGGSITVVGVEGEMDGETMGGAIDLKNLKGEIDFTTMGGSIELNDSDVDGKVSTMGGKVLFNNVVGDVDGSSMGGNVIYNNVRSRNGKSTGREVKISTMGGNIKVDEALAGADVSTMGGRIEVRKAAKHVKANTMGGDIEIDEIDGWVKATTMGGDVIVTMTGDPSKGKRDVNISSMGGDIELTLPDGISAEFDLRITYTRRSSQDYQIKSDFDLEVEEDEEWNYRNGDSRKNIDATGKTGSGEHIIKISTVNGDIRIKKN